MACNQLETFLEHWLKNMLICVIGTVSADGQTLLDSKPSVGMGLTKLKSSLYI